MNDRPMSVLKNQLGGIDQHRRLLVAIGVFVVMLVFLSIVSEGSLSYFGINILSTNTGALVFAAMGQTIVFLLGGFDLSAGATLSLVNIIVAQNTGDSTLSQVLMVFVGIGVGAAVGAFNGFFIAFMRLQPVVVTLASMFIILGLNLLLMPNPGGYIPNEFSYFFTGDLIVDGFPAALVWILLALVIWALIKRTRFGTAIYAVGSSEEAAHANGISVARTKFFGYMLSGCFYGCGGVFLSAQTMSGDALVGREMLLLIFAATILGGTRIGGGQGGCLGTAFAAFTLTMISNVLLTMNVSSHYTSIVEAVILILAVIFASIGRDAPIADYFRLARLQITGLATRSLPALHPGTRRDRLRSSWTIRPDNELTGSTLHQWFTRNGETLRLVTPAWALLVVVYILILIFIGPSTFSTQYFNSLLTLALFLSVLAIGQGAVVLTGGLDLSVPNTLAFAGLFLAAVSNGANGPAYWAIPAVLGFGLLVGLANGLGIVIFGMPAIVVTLATNGIMQGIGLLYTGGIPTGRSPAALQWLFNERFLGFAPASWSMLLIVAAAVFLLHKTSFGRRIFAVGNSQRAAQLSGVRVDRTIVGVYALSGFCSALAGVLMTGFSSISFLRMGEPYLLPSIAVVLVGGTLATGGRGIYLGMFGGALLLTAVNTLVVGTDVPVALRDVVFGAVILGAVLSLREKSA